MTTSDKNCVVIEFGRRYTRVGFDHETAPRAIVRSTYYSPKYKKNVDLFTDNQMDKEHWSLLDDREFDCGLKNFIQSLYFRHLGVNFKERKVILVESIFIRTKVRQLLTSIFFNYFEVPSLLIAPSHLMALIPFMISTGIVVDVGFSETIVLPVVEGHTLLGSIKYAPLAAKAVNTRIREELVAKKAKLKINKTEREFQETDFLDETIVENIKVKTCFVAPFERGELLAKYKANLGPEPDAPPKDVNFFIDGERELVIPGGVRESAAEVLFELYGEEQTVATLFLEALLASPKDSRQQLAKNIVVIGGSSMLPGFKHRLKMELNHLLKTIDRYSNNLFTKNFLFHQPPCKENYVSWLGASIFGATEAINLRSTSKENYLKLKEKSFVDWSDWWPKLGP